jgi:glutamyl-Q tRNA(Asp) synthetase
MPDIPLAYRGRFAPSPTGPLHFGSLVAAVGSYAEARHRRGAWYVRMEDLDPPRVMAGAADDILRTLEAFGFTWDGAVMYQSGRNEAYREALDTLARSGALYACACSRREIADSNLLGIEGPVYPGTCRPGLPPGRGPRTWRVRTDDTVIAFDDAWQGRIARRIESEMGDFVVRRADGLFAYQLAVVVDDALQRITHVVRGADLIESTPRQIHLQHLLGLPTPEYGHLPVAINARGEKLSKQTFAEALNPRAAATLLHRALAFLGQTPPAELMNGDIADLWAWTIAHWHSAAVPRERALPYAA